ncbi:MAG TPA: tRNA (adenosine(37)-N6)-dimethylallyltransferase MiaA [Planctomycetota bacterium]
MITVRILCGPTASGKSAVGLLLAEKFGAEILSIDSMKIYRGLNIGTGKPPPETLARVKHHLIDIREPWESFSVAEFLKSAEGLIADCAGRGVPLIGEGGTALCLKALTEGLFDGPGRDTEVRAALEAEAAQISTPKLHERLAALDPQAARKILPSDLRRIVRALEVHTLTGTPISEWQSQWGVARTDLDVRLACLRLPRESLYPRIDRRIDAMLAEGWIEECRRLLALPQAFSREALQALGYRTFFAHLRGEMDLAAARERVCFDTHHFARRQINWFKRLPKLTFVDITEKDSPDQIAARVEAAWHRSDSAHCEMTNDQ